MAKRKNSMKKKKQQPVSQEMIRPVVETDKWCDFRKKNESSKAPYGYVVEVSKKKEFNLLSKELPSGYIVRSKLIKGVFYVQFIPKQYFFGPEPEYTVHSFMEEITKYKKRRILNVLNERRPKHAKRPSRKR